MIWPYWAELPNLLSSEPFQRSLVTFFAVLAIAASFNCLTRSAKPARARPARKCALYLATPLLGLNAVPVVWGGYAYGLGEQWTPWNSLSLLPFTIMWMGLVLFFWAIEFVQRTELVGGRLEFWLRGVFVFVMGAACYFSFAFLNAFQHVT